MIFKIIGVVLVVVLLWLAYTRFPSAPARISQTVPAYDNQFEVFRDMEPADQTRENPWLGFIQEDVRRNRWSKSWYINKHNLFYNSHSNCN